MQSCRFSTKNQNMWGNRQKEKTVSLFKTLYVILELILINEGRSEMDDGWALLESTYILQLLFLEA